MVAYLRGRASSLPCRPVRSRDGVGDEDLQLALYCCYELHYRGFESVSDGLEWDPDVLRFRDGLERAYTRALLDAVPQPKVRDPRDAGELIERAIREVDALPFSFCVGSCSPLVRLLLCFVRMSGPSGFSGGVSA